MHLTDTKQQRGKGGGGLLAREVCIFQLEKLNYIFLTSSKGYDFPPAVFKKEEKGAFFLLTLTPKLFNHSVYMYNISSNKVRLLFNMATLF